MSMAGRQRPTRSSSGPRRRPKPAPTSEGRRDHGLPDLERIGQDLERLVSEPPRPASPARARRQRSRDGPRSHRRPRRLAQALHTSGGSSGTSGRVARTGGLCRRHNESLSIQSETERYSVGRPVGCTLTISTVWSARDSPSRRSEGTRVQSHRIPPTVFPSSLTRPCSHSSNATSRHSSSGTSCVRCRIRWDSGPTPCACP